MAVYLKPAVYRVMRGVARENGHPKYIPLDKLPIGTTIGFVTRDHTGYGSESDVPQVNGKPEELVTYLAAGPYFLKIMDWGVLRLSGEDIEPILIKPLFNRFAVTSTFTANYDKDYVTFRLQTGFIEKIWVDNMMLKFEDLDKPKEARRTRREVRGHYKPIRRRRFDK